MAAALALALPASSSAADGGAEPEASRAAAALGAGSGKVSPASAALAAKGSSRTGGGEGERSGGGDSAEAGPARDSADEAAAPTRPEMRPRSRAEAALADEGSGRSLEEELDARAEALREGARARREATRRLARSLGRHEEGRKGTSERGGARRDRVPEGGEAVVSIQSHRIELLPGNRNIIVRRRALVRGYLPSRRAGEGVVLELLLKDGRWTAVDRGETIEDGRFYLTWYPSRPGYFRVRVRASASTRDPEPSGVRLLYVFRRAVASWYGPGFYGNRTACGQTFSKTLMGVAHKTLPCGYRLTVRYRGRSRTIRVVDRGPYVHGRDYDLTEALRNYLGFDGVDEILATA